MFTWNYRITSKTVKGVKLYGISEVFYSKRGKVKGYTDWIDPSGRKDIESIRFALTKMLEGLDKPDSGIDLDK